MGVDQRRGGVESESGVTPFPSVRDPSSFVSQLSSFGGRGAVGNGFGIGVGGGVGVGGGGGGSSEILQVMQMDKSPLYTSQGFGGGGGSSDSDGLGGRGWMRLQRRDSWRRGRQQRGMLLLSYWPCLTVRGRCRLMLSHAGPNQWDGVFCCWWRRTLLVAAHSIGGGGRGKNGSWRKS